MYYPTVWENQYDSYEVATYYSVDPNNSFSVNNLSNINRLFNDGEKGVEVFDVKFDSKIKAAERQDYLFSIFSGSVAAAIDQFVIGKTDLKSLKDLDNKELASYVYKALAFFKYSQKDIDKLKEEYEKTLDSAGDKLQNATKYKKLAVDFRNSLSIKGLVFSILSAVTGYTFGEDNNKKISFVKNENNETLKDKTLLQKVQLGFIEWILIEAENYNGTGKFAEEINDLVKGKDTMKKAKELIKDLASTKIIKDKDIDNKEVFRIIAEKTKDDTNDLALEIEQQNLLKKSFNKQIIPVLVNKSLVRSY